MAWQSRLIVALLLLWAMPGLSRAQAPMEGTFKSVDLGGAVLTGRASESWTTPSGGGQLGNTVHAASWDGARLATQWRIWCMSVDKPPTMIMDALDSGGNGQQTWMTTYTGGNMWLAGSGPWAGGASEYNAVITLYVDVTTFHFAGGVPVAGISNVNLQASFIGYAGNCMTFAIANGFGVGSTDAGSFPVDYPVFLDKNCLETGVYGAWGDITGLTISIVDCRLVPAKETSWGAVKSIYSR